MSRVTFTASPTGAGTASISALDALGQVSLKVRFDAALVDGLGDGVTQWVLAINKTRGGSPVRVGVSGRGGGSLYRVEGDASFLPAVTATNVAKSGLPAGDVVLYAQLALGTGNGQVILFNAADGTVLNSASATLGSPASTGAGTGAITLHNGARAASYDGLALYSAALSGDARWQSPVAGEANLVAFWGFEEGTGSSADDTEGPVTMTLTNNGWDTGGEWPAPSGPSPAAIHDYLTLNGLTPGV